MNKIKLKPPGAMGAVLNGLSKGSLGTFILIIAMFVSAFTLIVMTHEQRRLYAELETLEQQREQLDVEWRRLRLEQRVMVEHSRLEKIARRKLGMKTLGLKSERIVRQVKDRG